MVVIVLFTIRIITITSIIIFIIIIIIVICDKHTSWYEGDDGMMVYPSDVW